MAQRMQSPSSINMYRQCPRKYYYRYIARLPTKPSIHLVRGTIAHSVLEFIFDEEFPKDLDWRTALQLKTLQLLEKYWKEHEEELNSLELTPEELNQYKEETKMMLLNWEQHLAQRITKRMELGMSFEEALELFTPQREIEYRDEELQVRGYIDAVEEVDGEVHLIDYKTSKKPVITSDYRLQLGIYALMYLRKHQEVPAGVGIHFLRHDKQVMQVNDDLLLEAQFEIEQVHMMTQSNSIVDYPKNITPLCNWCDFYEVCFAKKR